MKHAFLDSDGKLTAHGHIEAHGNDSKITVSDDFNLAPSKWRFDGMDWHEVAPAPPSTHGDSSKG